MSRFGGLVAGVGSRRFHAKKTLISNVFCNKMMPVGELYCGIETTGGAFRGTGAGAVEMGAGMGLQQPSRIKYPKKSRSLGALAC